jgi:hypothetical protein
MAAPASNADGGVSILAVPSWPVMLIHGREVQSFHDYEVQN